MNIIVPVLLFVGLGVGAGVLLSVFSRVFAVEVDERVEQIKDTLPGLNCGACGFSGCEDYASQLAENNNLKSNLCTPGGSAVAEKVSAILGQDFEAVDPVVAEIQCQSNTETTSDIFAYEGIFSCSACNLYYGGKGKCTYGCLGFGDCRDVCQYGAIILEPGKAARIDEGKCIGCGMCVTVCPKGIISTRKKAHSVSVKCFNCDPGKFTRADCLVGCIGCKRCEKICPHDAIYVEENRARIDYERCTGCKSCVDVCPVNCIVARS